MARQTGPIQARLEYAAIAAFAAPIRAMPLERGTRLGAWLGALAARLDPFERGVAMRNLEIAFPAASRAERRRILAATYANWGRCFAEWIHFDELDRGNLDRFVTYRNEENLREAYRLTDGRGVLILTGHFGNFELLPLAYSIHSDPVALVTRPLRNPLVDTAVRTARTRFGNQAIPRAGAGRQILRLLRKNWMVGIPLDLDTRRGVFVDFFSLKAATSDALARVSLATGAPVVPTFLVRDGASIHHWLTFLEPIVPRRRADREAAVLEHTQIYTTVMERMIREHPDHWNWIHRRWKTRPPGESRFY